MFFDKAAPAPAQAGRHGTPALRQLTLPPEAVGQWCIIRATADAAGLWWIKLELTDATHTLVVREAFLGRIHRRRRTDWRDILIHVPAEARAAILAAYGQSADIGSVEMRILGRTRAAWELLRRGHRGVPSSLRGDRLGAIGRTRAAMSHAALQAGETPPYSLWAQLFDCWSDADRAAFAHAAAGHETPIHVAVLPGTPAALQATCDSVVQGWVRPACGIALIETASDWATLDAAWIAILQAGEVLTPHALACLAHAASARPDAAVFCADLDCLDATGQRQNPVFTPQPDSLLIRAGGHARGVWLVRRDAFPATIWAQLPLHADAARRILAIAAGEAAMLRLPAILTHRRWDTAEKAAFLMSPRARGAGPLVSIIIPSACRSAHVLRCLRRILAGTDYANFELLLAVSRVDPSDRRQAAMLRDAAADPRVRVLDLHMSGFNYARVNNHAARSARGEMILLLNDDVAPIGHDWLGKMVAHLHAPGVGAVGARLLYGNDTVQHGGTVMGLGNLCDHSARFCPDPIENAPSAHTPWWQNDREVSAVTGACLLVHADMFAALGGLDETFAIALNDVDFCLRLRATGARVVYAGSAPLYHYESLSFGRHYGGRRAGLESHEISMLRARWHEVIADDPCYNPQGSLESGRMWEPGFGRKDAQKPWIDRMTPAAC